jgi:uncharacterized membrane protein
VQKNYLGVFLWVGFVVAFVAFLIVFNATLDYARPADTQTGNHYEKAKVTRVVSDTLAPDPEFPELKIGVQELEFEILTGANKGKSFIGKNFVTRLTNTPASVGTKMIVSSYDGFISGMVTGYSRESSLYILGLLFAAIVCVFGRIKGIKSLMALAFTLICLLFLFVPMLLRGINPILAAVSVVALSTGVTLFSLNGWSKKTIAAGVSCILCTLLGGGIALLFGAWTHTSTYTTPEAEDLIFVAQSTSLSLPDIFCAGIIIACSGAVMDTAISIASALSEMKSLNPEVSAMQLWKSGMNIGRDVMGTMTNTLILAFVGSGINSILIVFMYQMPYLRMVNLDLLVVEILRGLSGSIAVVLSIPVTALLSAKAMAGKDDHEQKVGIDNA